MITEVNFKDSQIPMACSANLLQQNSYEISASLFDNIATALFFGLCKTAGYYAKTDHVTAVTVRDLNGQFLLGIRNQYIANEDDPSNSGNWEITASFNEEDFEGILPENNIDLFDQRATAICTTLAHTSYSMAFDNSTAMNGIYLEIIKCIIQWVHENAKVDSEIVLVLDKCFRIKGQIINNEVVKSITLEGECKQLAKNDKAGSEASGMK